MKPFRRKSSPRQKPIHVCHVAIAVVVHGSSIHVKTTVADRTGALWERWDEEGGVRGEWLEMPRPIRDD